MLQQWAQGASWQETPLPGKNTIAVCHDIRAYYTEAALELAVTTAAGPAPGDLVEKGDQAVVDPG